MLTPLCRHASLTLHVSASTPRNAAALAFDQSRFARFLSCGLRAATRVSSFFRANPFSKQKGPQRLVAPARLAILHCACRVPDQRHDVKLFFTYSVILMLLD